MERISLNPPPVRFIDWPNSVVEEGWQKLYLTLRAGILEVAAEIAAEQNKPLDFTIRTWSDCEIAMRELARLAPGDCDTPNGAERALRRAEEITRKQVGLD